MACTILDGPMGTALLDAGVPTPVPLWSAAALRSHPAVVGEIHAAYAQAGATVHTANTFRTRANTCPQDWAALARLAVSLARDAVPAHHRVAGSMAPIADCYRPDLSPPHPGPAHAALAEVLAGAGCDVLLCETFPHVGEGLAAVRAAVATGVETWAAFTAGPEADLLTPAQVRDAAARAADAGAQVVFINCVPARQTDRFTAALATLGIPFGAYANAGHVDEGMGWRPAPQAPERYLAHAQTWVDHGATHLGACCGTGPAVVAALARRFGQDGPRP